MRKITWEMLVLENLLEESPLSTPVCHVLPVRKDRKSSAHCKMFWMILATPAVSSDKKHLQNSHCIIIDSIIF